MGSSIRRRAKDGSTTLGQVLEESDHFITGSSKPKIPTLSATLYSVYLLSFGVILFAIALYFTTSFPAPNENNLDRFNSAKAMNILEGLVKIGPKVTGSKENEVIAVEYIMNAIKEISKSAEPVHKLEVDLQKVSGAFSLGGVGLHYSNVQNIVVRVGPKTNASLLINCHFDTVPTSPGASDDNLNCAVMLEVLRVVSSSKTPLSYGAIFLFNGAEENPLMAAHGFITQHKWAGEVAAFINLESCGAGGHEVMFQTGPKSPWIVEAYAEAAEHPTGNVVGEELFQGGVIPSDTDYRIFRDYGHVPGLDFAHYSDGYVYHTTRDNLESIKNLPGVIQHTGDNVLSMVKSFTGSNSQISKLRTFPKEQSTYFDILGLVFVHYTESAAYLLNGTTILASVICLLLTLRTALNLQLLFEIAVRNVAVLVGLILALAYNVLLAVTMDKFYISMSWFTHTYYLVPLYILPTIIFASLPICMVNTLLRKQKNGNVTGNVLLQFLPTQCFWTIILLVFMFFKIRSAFLLVLLVLPPAISFIMITLFYQRKDPLIIKLTYFSSTCIPSLILVYFTILSLKLFIPITGRAGPTINPEIPIAGLVTILTFATYSYLNCFSMDVRNIKSWAKYLMLFHAVTICALLFTNLGFPFSAETPQRILITDLTRNSTAPDESILWIEPLERRGVSVLPKIATLPTIKQFCTDAAPHCGLPWITAKLFMKSVNVDRWLPSTPHKLKDSIQLEVISDEISADNVRTLSLNMTGPDRMTLMIHSKLTLTRWSLDNLTPTAVHTSSTGKSYAIRHVHGLETPSWDVSLKFEMKDGDPKNLNENIHIDLAGHYIHSQTSRKIDALVSSLPEWTHVTPVIATLKSYKF